MFSNCLFFPPLGVEDINIVTANLPSYATVLISLGALLLCAYFILGCVCCPNKSIKVSSFYMKKFIFSKICVYIYCLIKYRYLLLKSNKIKKQKNKK